MHYCLGENHASHASIDGDTFSGAIKCTRGDILLVCVRAVRVCCLCRKYPNLKQHNGIANAYDMRQGTYTHIYTCAQSAGHKKKKQKEERVQNRQIHKSRQLSHLWFSHSLARFCVCTFTLWNEEFDGFCHWTYCSLDSTCILGRNGLECLHFRFILDDIHNFLLHWTKNK